VRRAAFALVVLFASPACAPKAAVSVPAAPQTASTSSQLDALRNELNTIFQAPAFERSFWSVLVKHGASGKVVYELNGDKLVMPGSTLKIVTAAVAAERLGWEHRFETRVVTTAPLENGVLRGDLIVAGGGDPAISERSDTPGLLRALAREVRDNGITRIEGGIVGDDDLLDDRGLGDGWTLDNLPYGYSAPVSALLYNEGSVDLMIHAGASAGDPVSIEVKPEGSGLRIDNRLATVAETGAGALTLQRSPGSSRVIVQGQIPAKSAPFARTASVDNPTLFFAEAFKLALVAEGVKVDGDAADIDEFVNKPDRSDERTLVARRSPPLRHLIAAMMRVSQNQCAELLLKSIGGRQTVQDVTTGWGVSKDSLVVADGSGLSRYNYATAGALVAILQRMQADEQHGRWFPASLPASGSEGPLERRFSGTAADGRVRAKTGTVDNVRGIAGYVQSRSGETLVFSIIANNFTVPNSVIDDAANRALSALAALSSQP
jgi:D-alanyl-D-alanine carboxypeptidase/D-alanyl-D-alanine-endopeptidase (penicillin-binding protein 4)